jgi:predicted transcriptional regulator
MLSLRLDDRLRAQLEEIAKRNDRSLSAEIRRALKKHVTAEAQA